MGQSDGCGQEGDPGAANEAQTTREQVFAALDLLERYFKQHAGHSDRAVDLVLCLRSMASGSSLGAGTIPADASNPLFEEWDRPGRPGA